MNRSDLVQEVYAGLNGSVSKAVIDRVIKAEEAAKLEALENGHKVQLLGFGTYSVRTRAARTGRNPQTGESIQIAQSKTITFKPGSNAKRHVK